MYSEVYAIFHLIIIQFRMIFIYWIAGVMAGAAVSVFLGPRITGLAGSISGKRSGIIAVLLASLLGAASPLCMYGTIPLIAALGRKGMPEYVISTFMVSSILVNPNLFVFSLTLGLPIALLRLFASLAAGLVAGTLTAAFFKRRKLFNFEGFEDKKRCSHAMPPFKKFLNELNRTIVKTFPYLLAGIVLTALSDRYIPKNVLISLFGRDNGWGVILASSISVPLYVCGGGTIPIIKSWLEAGMSPGSALAFMLGGPATKLTNLGAVKTILGTGNFIIYILYSLLFSIFTGWLVNLVYRLL